MSTTNIKIKPNINNFYKNKVITLKSISVLIQLTDLIPTSIHQLPNVLNSWAQRTSKMNLICSF